MHIKQNFKVDLLQSFLYGELLKINLKIILFFVFNFLNREPGSSQIRQNINGRKLMNK